EMSTADLKIMSGLSEPTYDTIVGIHDIIDNSYLELQGIHSDTSDLTKIVAPIKQMSSDISSMKDKIKTL
ncbi:MAG: hypothetical protein WCR86_13880, partial [Parabacteroides sp.]